MKAVFGAEPLTVFEPQKGRTAIPYEMPRGCAAAYFPEANILVPATAQSESSGTPISARYGYDDVTVDGNGVGFLVINASFTAVGATQKFSIESFKTEATTNGTQLNAYQIRQIPEPSSIALLGLGGLALVLGRKK